MLDYLSTRLQLILRCKNEPLETAYFIHWRLWTMVRMYHDNSIWEWSLILSWSIGWEWQEYPSKTNLCLNIIQSIECIWFDLVWLLPTNLYINMNLTIACSHARIVSHSIIRVVEHLAVQQVATNHHPRSTLSCLTMYGCNIQFILIQPSILHYCIQDTNSSQRLYINSMLGAWWSSKGYSPTILLKHEWLYFFSEHLLKIHQHVYKFMTIKWPGCHKAKNLYTSCMEFRYKLSMSSAG